MVQRYLLKIGFQDLLLTTHILNSKLFFYHF